jgi:hypothetical protein
MKSFSLVREREIDLSERDRETERERECFKHMRKYSKIEGIIMLRYGKGQRRELCHLYQAD